MLLNQTISFNELLSEELKNYDKQSQDDICLITNEPLNNTKIKLFCGHSFNFKPLFKEVRMQKCVANHKETQRLGKYEFKCPYCRTNIYGENIKYYNNIPYTFKGNLLYFDLKVKIC